MRHKTVEKYFLELIDETLPFRLKEKVEAHLKGCPQCRESLEKYQRLIEVEKLMASDARVVGPEFRVQVMEAIEERASGWKEGIYRVWGKVGKGFSVSVAVFATACVAILIAREEIVTRPELIRESVRTRTKAVEDSQFGKGQVEEEAPRTFAAEPKALEKLKQVEAKPEAETVASNNIVTSDLEQKKETVPLIPPGYRAVTVGFDTRTSVEGLSKPNTRVDVLFTFADRDAAKKVATIARFAKVLSFGGQTANTESSEGKSANTVTLLVTERDAQRIELGKTTGQLSLVLVGENEQARMIAKQPVIDDSNRQVAMLNYDAVSMLPPPKEEDKYAEPPVKGRMLVTEPKTGQKVNYCLRGGEWKTNCDEGTEAQAPPAALPLMSGSSKLMPETEEFHAEHKALAKSETFDMKGTARTRDYVTAGPQASGSSLSRTNADVIVAEQEKDTAAGISALGFADNREKGDYSSAYRTDTIYEGLLTQCEPLSEKYFSKVGDPGEKCSEVTSGTSLAPCKGVVITLSALNKRILRFNANPAGETNPIDDTKWISLSPGENQYCFIETADDNFCRNITSPVRKLVYSTPVPGRCGVPGQLRGEMDSIASLELPENVRQYLCTTDALSPTLRESFLKEHEDQLHCDKKSP